MESQTISKDSFAYKLSAFAFPNRKYYDQPDNICEFRTMVLMGALRGVIATFVTFLYAFCLTQMAMLGYFCGSLVCGSASEHWIYAFGGAFIAITVIGFFTALIVFGIIKYRDYLDNKPYSGKRPKPNPITLAYRSWKEKICYPVNVQ